MIRKALITDLDRLAEILVFNNRQNYFPIFNDIVYSFKEYTVKNVTEDLLNDQSFIDNTYVFEDRIIMGFIYVKDNEIIKLYVDHFFQGNKIGKQLIEFGINDLGANNVWVLEKNVRAIKFYNRYGFIYKGDRKPEDGTTEYLLHLIRI